MVLKIKKGPGDGFSFSSWLEDRYLLATSAVRDLIRPPSVETLNQRLSYAVFTDEVLSAKRALRQGADPNGGYSAEYETVHKGVPHILVAAECASPRMLSLLIDGGASVDKTSADGETALQVAASMQRGEQVKILLECGANVNYVARIPGTALDAYDNSIFRAKYGENSNVRDALNKAGARNRIDIVHPDLDALCAIAEAGPLLDKVAAAMPAPLKTRLEKLQEDVGLEVDHEITGAPLTGPGPGEETTALRAAYQPVTLRRLGVLPDCLLALPSGGLADELSSLVKKLPVPEEKSLRSAPPAPKP